MRTVFADIVCSSSSLENNAADNVSVDSNFSVNGIFTERFHFCCWFFWCACTDFLFTIFVSSLYRSSATFKLLHHFGFVRSRLCYTHSSYHWHKIHNISCRSMDKMLHFVNTLISLFYMLVRMQFGQHGGASLASGADFKLRWFLASARSSGKAAPVLRTWGNKTSCCFYLLRHIVSMHTFLCWPMQLREWMLRGLIAEIQCYLVFWPPLPHKALHYLADTHP